MKIKTIILVNVSFMLCVIYIAICYIEAKTQSSKSVVAVSNKAKSDDNKIAKFVSKSVLLGPVLLKVDDEWLFEVDNKKIVRIGFLQNPRYICAESDYEIQSPKFLSRNTRELILTMKKSRRPQEREIYAYDIEIIKNNIWVDTHIVANFSHDIRLDYISTYLSAAKDFYIYHPIRKEWFGLESRGFSIGYALYSEIYNETNTVKDVKFYLNKFRSIESERVIEQIINNRTMIIPSIKFYEEKIEPLTSMNNNSGWRIYCWYVEKAR